MTGLLVMEAQVARGIIADAPHVLDVVQLGAHMGASANSTSSQWRSLLPAYAHRKAFRLRMTDSITLLWLVTRNGLSSACRHGTLRSSSVDARHCNVDGP